MESLQDKTQNFQRAKKFIKRTIGINLTLIEAVELKNIVGHTTNLFIQDSSSYLEKAHRFDPDYEAALIFLNKNYGTGIYSISDKADFNLKKKETEKLVGFDYYSQFFKKLQDEMHLP